MARLEQYQQKGSTINELCSLGFAYVHVPRMDNCGGVVGVLYNKCYKIEKQDVITFLSFEYMEVLLRTPTTVLRIAVLYRLPPSTENGLTAIMFNFQGISYFTPAFSGS